MSLQTPLTTGAVRDCCVEGRRRVTHRAEAARGWFTPVCLTVKPVGEPDAGDRHVRFDERGWETGRWPQAPSYRAHPRLYRSVGSLRRRNMSGIGCKAEVHVACTNRR